MTLTINGRVYNYPDPGTEMGWGEDATNWAEAVTSVVNQLTGGGSLVSGSFAYTNNSLNQIVSGLSFSSISLLSATIDYNISLDTGSTVNETGKLNVQYESGTWNISRTITSSTITGADITITGSGQVQISTPNYSGFVSGTMKFNVTNTVVN